MSSKRKTPIEKITPDQEARFEQFLQKQFSILKDELSEINFEKKNNSNKNSGSLLLFKRPPRWLYAVAAVVLAAVMIPFILELNLRRESTMRSSSSSQTDTLDLAENRERSREQKITAEKTAAKEKTASEKSLPYKAEQKKLQNNRSRGFPEEKNDDEGYFSATEASPTPITPNAPSVEAAKPLPAAAPTQGSKPRDASPRDAKPISQKGKSSELAESVDELPVAKSRSLAADDNVPNAKESPSATKREEPSALLEQEKLQNADKAPATAKRKAPSAELKEMETLWNEFEKNPDAFRKKKEKMTRLKKLLQKYDTRNRVRRL